MTLSTPEIVLHSWSKRSRKRGQRQHPLSLNLTWAFSFLDGEDPNRSFSASRRTHRAVDCLAQRARNCWPTKSGVTRLGFAVLLQVFGVRGALSAVAPGSTLERRCQLGPYFASSDTRIFLQGLGRPAADQERMRSRARQGPFFVSQRLAKRQRSSLQPFVLFSRPALFTPSFLFGLADEVFDLRREAFALGRAHARGVLGNSCEPAPFRRAARRRAPWPWDRNRRCRPPG